MSIEKNKKGKILEEAAKIFARDGFEKASVDEISLKAKVAKGTVYYYFKSKQDLFDAIILEGEKRFRELIENKIKNITDVKEKLKKIIEAEKEFVLSYQEEFKVFIGYILDRKHSFGIIEEVVEEGKKQNVFRKDMATKEMAMSIFWTVVMTTLNGQSEKQKEFILKAVLV
ncbi:MAG TPA: TetR/AcrR family transcriptional regulator [Candidatus Woesebacteria bacterium]|nr:TetR/AcrR family transcriptional regulator [Candidatus Woesebacteria bacterium]HPJ17101.1 TetR/AcrR family transcriptional regulator [Candidatus Woesebacteria bacterium]